MVTYLYGFLLVVSIAVIIYMAQKNYESIDIRYWSMVILVPIIVLGYWLKTMVGTEEEARLAFCFIYLDSTVLVTLILFCIMHFLHIKAKPWFKIVGYGAAFAHMMMIWLCYKNNLYYESVTVIRTTVGSITKTSGGPLKAIHWVYLSIVFLIIVGLMVTAIIKKGTYSRRTFWLYAVLLIIGIFIYGIESIQDVDFTSLPVLYVLSDIMIAMNYDHAHMHDIASLISEEKEYSGTKGYVALDLEKRFVSCNTGAFEFLPDLEEQVVDAPLVKGSKSEEILDGLIESYLTNRTTSTSFESGERIFKCEISEFFLRKGGKSHGYLFDIRDVTEEQKVLQVMHDYNDTLATEVNKKTDNIKNIQRKVVLGLANMVENRDNNTGGHVKRTSDIIGYVVDAVRRQGHYNIDDRFAEDIVRAAPMHDLGKITIENSILCKPGKLTDEEYAIMKTHSTKSGEFVNIILKDVEEEHFVNVAFNVARFHHERWDGRGYPEGLIGEMIPLEARIMAIADVYDALVSKRCYKKPMSFEQASQIMLDGMGTQFDPNMYTVFLDCREQLENYYKEN